MNKTRYAIISRLSQIRSLHRLRRPGVNLEAVCLHENQNFQPPTSRDSPLCPFLFPIEAQVDETSDSNRVGEDVLALSLPVIYEPPPSISISESLLPDGDHGVGEQAWPPTTIRPSQQHRLALHHHLGVPHHQCSERSLPVAPRPLVAGVRSVHLRRPDPDLPLPREIREAGRRWHAAGEGAVKGRGVGPRHRSHLRLRVAGGENDAASARCRRLDDGSIGRPRRVLRAVHLPSR